MILDSKVFTVSLIFEFSILISITIGNFIGWDISTPFLVPGTLLSPGRSGGEAMVLNGVIINISLIFKITIFILVTIGNLIRWFLIMMMLFVMFLMMLLVASIKLDP